MENYLSMRIMQYALDYVAVVTRYPQFKEGIDKCLIDNGFSHMIVKITE